MICNVITLVQVIDGKLDKTYIYITLFLAYIIDDIIWQKLTIIKITVCNVSHNNYMEYIYFDHKI